MNAIFGGPVRPNLPPHLMDEGERAAALVEKSTSEILLQVDWSMNMEVVDALNRASHQEVKKEIIRQIRKRLQSRSTRVVSMALSLIETVVKNCGPSVHQEVATSKFMAQMARVARTYHEKSGRENLQVADKALDLIQAWGEAFLPMASTVPLFSHTYHELRREGLPFRKQYDETKVPVLTPPPSGGTLTSASERGQEFFASQGETTEVEMLGSVETTVSMLKDFLQNAERLEDLTKNDIFAEILGQGMKLVKSLQEAIEAKVIAGSENLEEYFKANDNLQATLQLYEGVKDRSIALPLPKAEPAPPAAQEELISFDDFLAGGEDAKPSAPSSTAPNSTTTATSTLSRPSSARAAETNVPKLAPSRRDSFGKGTSARRRSRGLSTAANDLLDLSSLDIADASSGPLSSSGTYSTTPNPFDAPNQRPHSYGFHVESTPSFAIAPPAPSSSSASSSSDLFPTLPPPRALGSPPPNNRSSSMLSSSLNGSQQQPPQQQQQQQQQGFLSASGSIGGPGLSSTLNGSAYGGGQGQNLSTSQHQQQQQLQQASSYGQSYLPQPPSQQAGLGSTSSNASTAAPSDYGGYVYPSNATMSQATHPASQYATTTSAYGTAFPTTASALTVDNTSSQLQAYYSQPAYGGQQAYQQQPSQQADTTDSTASWATYGSSTTPQATPMGGRPQQQQQQQAAQQAGAAPSQNPFDAFPF